jgi:phosphohistidine phosphatase SixA
MLQRLTLAVLLIATPLVASAQSGQADPEALWTALAKGGHVALMRHAQTVPGTGDPPNFRIGDCSTQRNLAESGLAQARRFGAEFKRRGIVPAAIYVSEWCRAVDTGEAFGLGEVRTRPAALNSFFENRGARQASTAALRDLMDALPRGGPPVILVTHQVNVTAATGVFPASGETVILRLLDGGGFEVAGRLPPP